MDILDDPIKLNKSSTVDLGEFFREFNMLLAGVHSGNEDTAKKSARQCIDLCRTAISSLAAAGNVEMRKIQQIAGYFSGHSNMIIKAGKFEFAYEFDILASSKDGYKWQSNKNKLRDKYLTRFVTTKTQDVHEKHQAAAMWGDLRKEWLLQEDFTRRNLARMREGLLSDDITTGGENDN